MNEGPEDFPDPIIPPSNHRMRSVPFRFPFLRAEFFGLLHYCAFIAVITAMVQVLVYSSSAAIKLLIVTVAIFGISGFASFLARRGALCPLCKGMPLVGSRARVHHKAFRIFPLGPSASAVLSLLFTQTFRCMYCGSRFDIMKPRPKPHTTAIED